MVVVGLQMLRVAGVATALICAALPSAAAGERLEPDAPSLVETTQEPFDPGMLLPAGGGILGKWLAVRRQWEDERQIIVACREDRSRCADPAALKFLAIVDDVNAQHGRARLGVINRAVNLAIKPTSDQAMHGAIDVWSSPLATLARGAGDCEDYAIVKYAALLEAGVSPDDLRLLIIRDSRRLEDHAVVSVRHENEWLVLDNLRFLMLADTQLPRYLPLVSFDGRGARRYADVSAPAELPAIRTSSLGD